MLPRPKASGDVTRHFGAGSCPLVVVSTSRIDRFFQMIFGNGHRDGLGTAKPKLIQVLICLFLPTCAVARTDSIDRFLPAPMIQAINQQPTVWQTYRDLLIPGIVLLLAQGLIIFALLRQRAKRLELRAELVRANERLRLAMQTGKTVGWEWDLVTGGGLIFGDLRAMIGAPSDVMTGKPDDFYRYIHPEDRKRVSEALTVARHSCNPYAQDFRIVWPEVGTTHWVASRGKFEYAPGGKATRMVGLAVDITDRRTIEEALKKSEEKFSKVFRESPTALTVTSTVDSRYIDVNETFQKLTGWTSDEVVGRTPLDIGIWVDPSKRTDFVKRLMAGERIREFELTYRTRDGQERVGLAAADLIDLNGELCALSVIADITEMRRAEAQEQISQRRFSQFFETIPEYCYITSPDGEILDTNPAACKMLGYAKDEIVGKPLSAIYDPESFSRIIDLLEKWKNTGTLRNEELVIVTRNGEKRDVLLNAGSVLDATGNLLFSTSVHVDITDFKAVQKRLQEDEGRLDAIIESAMDAVIATDENQLIVVFNPAAESMFRCSAKEAIGTSFDRFIPPRFRNDHKSHLSEFGRTGLTTRTMGILSTSTLRAQRANGEEFPMEASISAADVGGRKLFTAIIRDVTQRRQAEEALSEYAAIVESSTDAITSMNLEGMILSWNPGAQRMYGYTKEEAIGKPITIIIPPDLHNEAAESLRRAVAGERIDNFESVRVSKSGRRIEVGVTRSPIRDANGKLIGISGIARDITATKQATAALRESEERFRLVATAAPVMIWMSGPDKLCTFVNQPWLEFTGRAIDAELGNGWADGVHPEDLTVCLKTYTEAFDRLQNGVSVPAT
jgi:PAS domain S-box-containing protein